MWLDCLVPRDPVCQEKDAETVPSGQNMCLPAQFCDESHKKQMFGVRSTLPGTIQQPVRAAHSGTT